MRQVLNVEKHNYKIIISDENFQKLKAEIDSFSFGKKRLFVVSKRVFKLYGEHLDLPESEVFILNDGEKEKNIKNYIKILKRAEKMGLTRSDVIFSIGGGVVGDLAGFVASTYMRGINYVQIPTTLLAMIDSSVGGKTAIDMNGIKNLVGSFYQPKLVLINTNFLKTLDDRQFSSGLGEALKYAFIEDSCGYKNSLYLFEFLTLSVEKIKAKESLTIMRLVEYCLSLKSSVVSEDEKEAGLRKILNFGHTLAHALESITHYKKFTHGEAVVQGMFFIIDWAYSMQMITKSYHRMSIELLEKYGFKRINIKTKFPYEKLMEYIFKDKKASTDKITFIVPADKKQVREIALTADEVSKMITC